MTAENRIAAWLARRRRSRSRPRTSVWPRRRSQPRELRDSGQTDRPLRFAEAATASVRRSGEEAPRRRSPSQAREMCDSGEVVGGCAGTRFGSSPDAEIVACTGQDLPGCEQERSDRGHFVGGCAGTRRRRLSQPRVTDAATQTDPVGVSYRVEVQGTLRNLERLPPGPIQLDGVLQQ